MALCWWLLLLEYVEYGVYLLGLFDSRSESLLLMRSVLQCALSLTLLKRSPSRLRSTGSAATKAFIAPGVVVPARLLVVANVGFDALGLFF